MSKTWIAVLVLLPLLAIGFATAFIIHRLDSSSTLQGGDPSTAGLGSAPIVPQANSPLASNVSSDEIAKLQAENAQLKAEVAARTMSSQQIPPTVVVAQPTVVFGSIAGAAWLNRDNGDSAIQRGLAIRLLPTVIPSEGVIAEARTGVAKYKKMLADLDAVVTNLRNSTPPNTDGGVDADALSKAANAAVACQAAGNQLIADGGTFSQELSLGDFQKTIDDDTARVQKLKDFLQSAGQRMSVSDALGILVTAASNGHPTFDSMTQREAVASVSTGVDGKYSFQHIQPGNYFVCAAVNTPAISVDWAIPVQISGSASELDLNNGNAGFIANGQ